MDLRAGESGELGRFEAIRHRGIPGCPRPVVDGRRRVLVTGGTGCIGTALLALLSREGSCHLVSLARRPPGSARRISGVTYLRGDVRQEADVARAMAGGRVDLVVHLAAQRDPGLAERRIVETVSTNLYGTEVVLRVAGQWGVASVVVASTGKALRYFTSDVYAATKALLEYRVCRAAKRWGYQAACARFTHVVDNSLVYEKLARWTMAGRDVMLHGPEVFFFAQSAWECAALLLLGAVSDIASESESGLVALCDLGWPPFELRRMAEDMIVRNASSSRIMVSGYEPGYEEVPFSGTYDPWTAGDHSPLLNALEADRSTGAGPCPSSVEGLVVAERSTELDRLLVELDDLVRAKAGSTPIAACLRAASSELLTVRLSSGRRAALARVSAVSAGHVHRSDDHLVIAARLAELGAGPRRGALAASGQAG